MILAACTISEPPTLDIPLLLFMLVWWVGVSGGLVLVVAWCWWWVGVGGGLVLVVGWCWWWVGVGGGLVLVAGWCWYVGCSIVIVVAVI